ncbi:serine/threonine-protein kinase [Actinomadura xylanilytica]|uniref:serine/threonine-protein kinase n=1 Tax=Actinomadura xylanilytica TaxID=887459 RepID=UPI00255AD7E6|nr:serine/threonine-protein kinase [Actinomadura xylanilytica]MDL4770641.1 serine/threonine-protein kinase [Actinomadura xylanilytica]
METPSSAGRYTIDRLLGSGGFASVWLGRDEELDSPVAIKILAEHWAQRTDVHERFVQEARLLRQVDSHRLVQVFDIGEQEDGRPYFVMTYADRGTLDERLAEGPLPLNEALRMAREIIRGVQELHEVDIVHRDLKPSNVLLRSVPGGDAERVMISDLGIARTGDRLSSLTLPAGSPGYMAPEQTQIDGAPDQRADVYGLGALTYHMLTGEPPGQTRRPPSDLQPAIPHAVDQVVLRALEPDREKRWPSAAEFGHALSRTTSRINTDPLPPARPARGGSPARGRRRLAVITGGTLVGLSLAGGGAFWAFGGSGGSGESAPDGKWLRAGSDVPPQYRALIVQAGTWCDMKGLSPALIAAMLKAESNFDAKLSDPAGDEYGIARWTPKVLVFWQPGGLNNPEPKPAAITPELSIPAMGRYLCYWGKDLRDLPGDPALNLAATYRSSSKTVAQAGGVPARFKPYTDKVHRYLEDYLPR